jgi:hypothetical protein
LFVSALASYVHLYVWPFVIERQKERQAIMAGENWTFWLNMTNFALGIVTLLAVVVVAGAVSWDLFFLWLHKVRKGDVADISGVNMQRLMAEVRSGWGDAHSLSVPGLGLTMADGGEKIDSSDKKSEKQTPGK